jgi:hypothetical protein
MIIIIITATTTTTEAKKRTIITTVMIASNPNCLKMISKGFLLFSFLMSEM